MKSTRQYIVPVIILAAVIVIAWTNNPISRRIDEHMRHRVVSFMTEANPETNTLQICEDRAKTFDVVNGSITVILPMSTNNGMTCIDSKCCLQMLRVQGDPDMSTFDGVKDAQTHNRNVSFFTTRTGYAIVFGHPHVGPQRD